MKYIFSDESGDVYDLKESYYVRSFIFIEEREYESLKKVLEKIQKKTGLKELKFSNFKNNKGAYKEIFDLNFDAYVAFTHTKKDFLNEVHPYYFKEGFFRYLQEWDNTFYKRFTDLLKNKISSAIDYVFWLEYYEKHYILNSRNILLDVYKIDIFQSTAYKYFFDQPKFNKQDYIRIFRNFFNKDDYDIEKERIEIIQDSKKEEGIQVSDIFAGSVRDVLMNERKIYSHYKDYIFPKLLGSDGAKHLNRQNPCNIQMGGRKNSNLYKIKAKLY